MEESGTMGDAGASGAGETRRGPDVERAAHAVWFREVRDAPDLLEFYLQTGLRLIYLGGLTQAQAARKLAVPPAQLANHVAHGLHRVAALLTARAGTPQAERDTPEPGPGFRS